MRYALIKMFKLLKFLKKYKLQVFLGLFFKLAEAIMELFLPLLMSSIINSGGDVNFILNRVLIMLVIIFLGYGFAMIAQYSAVVTACGMGKDIRGAMYKNINRISYAELDKINPQSVTTRLTNDVLNVQTSINLTIRLLTRAPFLAVGSMIMAYTLNAHISLIFLSILPFLTLTIYLILRYTLPRFGIIQKRLDKLNTITSESLEGARVIRAFSKQDEESKRFNVNNEAYTKRNIKTVSVSAMLTPATTLIINLSIIAIIYVGGHFVDTGALKSGDIIAFITYMLQTLISITIITMVFISFTKAEASSKRINEVLELKPSIVNAEKPLTELIRENEILRFENVNFSYAGSAAYAAENINFSVNRGERIGIIGGTGSGKSTLVNLIPRFYEVSGGSILYNGINIKDIDIDVLRNEIVLTPQKSVAFSGTLRENLTLNKNIDDEAVLKACKTAQIYDYVIAKENGLDFKVLQNGRNLSGGEKQRLAIARALLKKPEVLILDDSTSALDFKTESRLRRELNENYPQLTVIIISQRVNSIKSCDKILVMEGGEIAGIGGHAFLKENNVIYKEICGTQGIK